MERQVPRHHARLLAQPPGRHRRVRRPLRRLVGPVQHGWPPAHLLGQPDYRPRRLHPAQPCLLQRQAQRGQRRAQTATGPATTIPGTAAPKAPPATPVCWRCAPAGPGPMSALPDAARQLSARRVPCRGWSGCCSACRRPCRAALAPALQVRPIRRFGVALMRMSGDGDDERLIP